MIKSYNVLLSIVKESNRLFTDKKPNFETFNWISGVCLRTRIGICRSPHSPQSVYPDAPFPPSISSFFLMICCTDPLLAYSHPLSKIWGSK